MHNFYPGVHTLHPVCVSVLVQLHRGPEQQWADVSADHSPAGGHQRVHQPVPPRCGDQARHLPPHMHHVHCGRHPGVCRHPCAWGVPQVSNLSHQV